MVAWRLCAVFPERMQSKSMLRNEYKKRRRALGQEDYDVACEKITSHLLALDAVRNAKMILSYVAHGREADTRTALATLVEEGKIVCTPGGRDPEEALNCFHFLTHDDPLLDRSWAPGYVPSEVCDAVNLADVDVFIVPAIVWDPDGYRIGYGGGYFDRLLAEAAPHALRVGLAYDWQVIDRVPRESWDMPVQCVVTDQRVIWVSHEQASGSIPA